MDIRKTMNDTQYFLEMLGYKIIDVMYDDGKLEYITFINKDLIGRITAPHGGNGNMFVVRAEIKDNFDRFSNVVFEKLYNIEDFDEQAYEPITLYRELMLIYYELYMDLCK